MMTVAKRQSYFAECRSSNLRPGNNATALCKSSGCLSFPIIKSVLIFVNIQNDFLLFTLADEIVLKIPRAISLLHWIILRRLTVPTQSLAFDYCHPYKNRSWNIKASLHAFAELKKGLQARDSKAISQMPREDGLGLCIYSIILDTFSS